MVADSSSWVHMQILKVENLNYYYGAIQALNNINFNINSGSITALVGPNGAGKSTLMRCLAGLEASFNGQIQVFESDIVKNPKQTQSKIGYLSDNFGLYEDLLVIDVLKFICGCHNLNHPDAKIKEVSEILNLAGVLYRKCSQLSRGWRQRVGIALTLVHDPKLLILDEPASGLDPESRADLSKIFKYLQERQIDIIVSSHILAELEDYCSSMLVMRAGRIVDHVSLKDHRKANKIKLVISFSRDLTAEESSVLSSIVKFEYIFKGCDLYSEVCMSTENQSEVLKALIHAELPVYRFFTNEKSLQELYLEMAK